MHIYKKKIWERSQNAGIQENSSENITQQLDNSERMKKKCGTHKNNMYMYIYTDGEKDIFIHQNRTTQTIRIHEHHKLCGRPTSTSSNDETQATRESKGSFMLLLLP